MLGRRDWGGRRDRNHDGGYLHPWAIGMYLGPGDLRD